MPNTVNSLPTLAPHTWEKIRATPRAIITNRATSRKIAGSRRRQLPSGAPWNSVALRPASSISNTRKPNTVVTIRTPVVCAEILLVCTMRSKTAPSGRT